MGKNLADPLSLTKRNLVERHQPICLMIAALSLSITVVTSAAASDLALVGGTIIPANGSPPIEDAVIVVADGVITAVGPRGEVDVPAKTTVFEAEGKFITPGLIDTNVHLILMTVPEFFVKYEDRLTDIALQSAQVGLKYGMTTMADTWGPLEPLLEARDRINRGEIVGSRVLVAGNIVGTGGPFSVYFMGSWDHRGDDMRYGGWVHPAIQRRINDLWEAGVGPELLAMTPEEAAAAMRAYLARGVDFVKLAVAGHGISPVEPVIFSPEAMRAMRAEVRKAGIPFQTHTFTVESLRLAVELQPEMLQHPNVMSPPWFAATDAQKNSIRESISTIVSDGIYCGLMAIPSKRKTEIYKSWNAIEHLDQPYLNKVMMNRAPYMGAMPLEARVEGLRVWIDGGVKYTLATDQGPEAADLGPVAWGRLGRAHFERLEDLQDCGEEPHDILVAATKNGAEAYGLGDRLGTIETGKSADLLVLDADPLEDIANLRKINQVIKDGRIVDREALPTVRVLDYDPEAPWPY
jgi:imidazolonepropionase-like amidohydrolase